jgi:nucleoid-associated protein YgaU
MLQNSIKDLPRLKQENYENIFNVYTDKDNRYYYNLLQTVIIPDNLPNGYYQTYNAVYGDTWPFISYKNYDTPNLWWVITSVNNILDATKQPEPGTVLKILKPKAVSLVLNQLTTQKS